jgi:hypothetical protein
MDLPHCVEIISKDGKQPHIPRDQLKAENSKFGILETLYAAFGLR